MNPRDPRLHPPPAHHHLRLMSSYLPPLEPGSSVDPLLLHPLPLLRQSRLVISLSEEPEPIPTLSPRSPNSRTKSTQRIHWTPLTFFPSCQSQNVGQGSF